MSSLSLAQVGTRQFALMKALFQIPEGDCNITVDGQTKGWSQKECFLFDDSFLHSAHNFTDDSRIILIVDLWHPNLTIAEVKVMQELFAVKDSDMEF